MHATCRPVALDAADDDSSLEIPLFVNRRPAGQLKACMLFAVREANAGHERQVEEA